MSFFCGVGHSRSVLRGPVSTFNGSFLSLGLLRELLRKSLIFRFLTHPNDFDLFQSNTNGTEVGLIRNNAKTMQPQFDSWLLRLILFIAQICSHSLGLSHQSNIPVSIQTKNGQLRGFESIFLHRRVRSFLSVPFAEPPIGDLRFKPPVAKRKWNTTIDTSALSPACYQGLHWNGLRNIL